MAPPADHECLFKPEIAGGGVSVETCTVAGCQRRLILVEGPHYRGVRSEKLYSALRAVGVVLVPKRPTIWNRLAAALRG